MKTLTKILGVIVLTLAQMAAQAPSPTFNPVPVASASQNSANELPPAHPTTTVDPKYPADALKAKRQGTVVLRALITKKGKVKDLSVISGDPDFAEAAMKAVKKWHFEPYLVDGKPEVEQKVVVNFTLPDEGQAPDSRQVSKEDFDKEVDARVAAGTLFRPSTSGVIPPRATFLEDPDYSLEAKDAHVSGTMLLNVIVEADGRLGDICVNRGLGYGLEEKVVDAVRRWRFKPATKDGKPVAAVINLDMTFHFN